ncbi:unnamed protein product [Owenia fusiformis]|uniref:RNA polymerase II subunit B1 CTD phosphatase RPAP2 homolog n=1 Tax=Owenia fusiformis TaxID=6347 RepID=A0A8J1XW92_OWEFU|nr:unnamed protein product [Owenia fusiformis]
MTSLIKQLCNLQTSQEQRIKKDGERRLLENNVDRDFFINCIKYLDVQHYKDVTEERAIVKLCGYPLCTKHLGKSPSKKYHISMKVNKVFDISERKNFCSNGCYQASRHYESQIPTEAVWLRDTEPHTTITLLEINKFSGKPGQEIVLINPKDALRNDPSFLPEGTTIDDPTPSCYGDIPCQQNTGDSNNKTKKPKDKNRKAKHNIPNTKSDDTDRDISSNVNTKEHIQANDGVKCKKAADSHDKLTYLMSLIDLKESITDKEHTGNVKDDEHLLKESKSISPDDNRISSHETNITHDSKAHVDETSINTIDPHSQIGGSSKQEENKITLNKATDSLDSDDDSDTYEENDIVTNDNTIKQRDITSEIKDKTTEVLNTKIQVQSVESSNISKQAIGDSAVASNKPMNLPQETVTITDAIEKCLREWKTADTVLYLLGESPQSKKEHETPVNDEHQEIIKAVKKKQEENEQLRRDDEQFQEKVKDYFKGQFHKPKPNMDDLDIRERDTQEQAAESVLPMVDSLSQNAIRRKILLGKLHKGLSPLLTNLGLSTHDVSTPLRDLVKTFMLTNRNVILRPVELTMMVLVLLYILSEREPNIKMALSSASAKNYMKCCLSSLNVEVNWLEHLRDLMLAS